MKPRRCRSGLWHGSFAIFNPLIIKSVLRSIIDVCLCLTFHIGVLHYDRTAFLLWNTYSSSWSKVMSVNEVTAPRTPAFFALFLVLFTFSRLTSILRTVFYVTWSFLVDHDQKRDRRIQRFLLLQSDSDKNLYPFHSFFSASLGPRYLPFLIHRTLMRSVFSIHSRIRHIRRGFVKFRYRQQWCTRSDHKLSIPMSWMCQIQSVV